MVLDPCNRAKEKMEQAARMADQLDVIVKALMGMVGGMEHSTTLKSAQLFLSERAHDFQMEYLARLHGHGDAFHQK